MIPWLELYVGTMIGFLLVGIAGIFAYIYIKIIEALEDKSNFSTIYG